MSKNKQKKQINKYINKFFPQLSRFRVSWEFLLKNRWVFQKVKCFPKVGVLFFEMPHHLQKIEFT
jgi:hypothetical protein